MRIGIDAMGGDRAPVEEVKGALAAREFLSKDDRLVLIGREQAVLEQLSGAPGWKAFIEVHHAERVIGMDEPPVESLRDKPDSSIAVMAEMQKQGRIDASISAGNTGAYVAAATMRLRRLRAVHRPGIAVVIMTHRGPISLCDVGANVGCRPQHLHQYGVMSSIYMNAVCGVASPRVALLSIGEEDAKGNDLVKRTRELLKEEKTINFVGNVEGRDLFRGVCDVVVCEGFVGNVVLKLIEGMAEGVIRAMVAEVARSFPEQLEVMKRTAQAVTSRFDFNEYGGAPLLGVNGICIICHGASDYRGFKNAVGVAMNVARKQVNARITEVLSRCEGPADG
jgi:glycerol-3-phosphate acyltransferase PlsX